MDFFRELKEASPENVLVVKLLPLLANTSLLVCDCQRKQIQTRQVDYELKQTRKRSTNPSAPHDDHVQGIGVP